MIACLKFISQNTPENTEENHKIPERKRAAPSVFQQGTLRMKVHVVTVTSAKKEHLDPNAYYTASTVCRV